MVQDDQEGGSQNRQQTRLICCGFGLHISRTSTTTKFYGFGSALVGHHGDSAYMCLQCGRQRVPILQMPEGSVPKMRYYYLGTTLHTNLCSTL